MDSSIDWYNDPETVSVEEIIDVPKAAAWALIRQWAHWDKWCHTFEYMDIIEGHGGVGTKRRFKMLESGMTYEDELKELDDEKCFLRYNFINSVPPLPSSCSVKETTVIHLQEVEANKTKIKWVCVAVIEGWTEAQKQGLFASQIKGHKKDIEFLEKAAKKGIYGHPPTAPVSEIIHVPKAAAWELIRQWAHWVKWCHTFEYMDILSGNGEVGTKRRYKMLESQKTYEDELVELIDKKCFLRYDFINTVPPLPSGVSVKETTTVHLKEIEPNKTRINWDCTAVIEGMNEEQRESIFGAEEKGHHKDIGFLVKAVKDGHYGDPPTAPVEEIIDVPKAAAWALLRDWINWVKWCHTFEYMESINGKEGVGAQRRYKMVESQKTYEDQLVELDDEKCFLRYDFINTVPPLPSGISVKETTTVKLEELGPNKTKINWDCTAVIKGMTHEQKEAVYGGEEKGHPKDIAFLVKAVKEGITK